MRFESLKAHLAGGKIEPLYLVEGEDEFLREYSVKMLCALANPLPELNLIILTQPTYQALAQAALVYPFGNARRIVVARGLDLKANEIPLLKDLVLRSASVLVIVEPPDNILKSIGALGIIVECNQMATATIEKWIARELQCQNRTISSQNARYLIELCGGKMSRINIEIQKLAFAGSGEVTLDSIDSLVEKSNDFKIYALSESVALRDGQQAFTVLDKLLAQKNEPASLLSMLYSHFRRLLYCALSPNENLASSLSIKEFAVTMAKRQAAKFSKPRLVAICETLRNSEYLIKSGKIKPEQALRLAMLKVMQD